MCSVCIVPRCLPWRVTASCTGVKDDVGAAVCHRALFKLLSAALLVIDLLPQAPSPGWHACQPRVLIIIITAGHAGGSDGFNTQEVGAFSEEQADRHV